MFEYVLIKDITDDSADARELSRLLTGLRAKVNLIPLNPAPEIPFERSDERTVLRFQRILLDHDITSFIRKNRGNDVSGACGQLKMTGTGKGVARQGTKGANHGEVR